MTADPELDLAREVERALEGHRHFIITIKEKTTDGRAQSGRACSGGHQYTRKMVIYWGWQVTPGEPCPYCLRWAQREGFSPWSTSR